MQQDDSTLAAPRARWRRWAAGVAIAFALGGLGVGGLAAMHEHEHGDLDDQEPPPRVFLDKSARIVWYQLNRLTNPRLLRVERSTDDLKYAPVYEAILKRSGMSQNHREEALRSLVALKKTDAATVLLETISGIDGEERSERRVTRQLADMVVRQPKEVLLSRGEIIQDTAKSDNPVARSAAFAAMLAAGQLDDATSQATKTDKATLDFLGAVVMIRKQAVRSSLRPQVVEWVSSANSAVQRAAIGALAYIEADRAETFLLVTNYFGDAKLRSAAVKTLLKIPSESRDSEVAARLANELVEHAESTPAAERTTDEFVDAMQLADQLLGKLPVETAKAYRQRLRAVTVRVVRLRTVQEEMRYDTPYFAVEAGRPVQIVLQNEDLMPHNLVVTAPGALREVAEAGAQVGPGLEVSGKPYVPKSDKVLVATDMVAAGQQVRLTFNAPETPGEYPYVCTFPRHWMRMYGVMVVVEDLDAWAKNPSKPKDPTGNNRAFVKSWTMDDFQNDLDDGLRGRSEEIGKRIFTEATCAQCHKMQGKGGAVGPELTDVLTRWKGDRRGVLREIIEPSHKIDPKYAVQVIITGAGKVISGVVVAEDKETISVVVNPEDPKPIVIEKDDIEDSEKSSKSLMPKALLDRFSKDEIFELLSYVTNTAAKSE